MAEKLIFDENDRIAVIAPHPDDECLGAGAALLMAPQLTDIYVLSDGCRGNKDRSLEEEAAVRKKQFEDEMGYVKPHAYEWLGYEDARLALHYEAAEKIDFTKYTKVFLPWHESLHPDHRAAADMCCRAISRQGAEAECFSYEVTAPFHKPSHYIDITDIADEKRKLVRFHEDQKGQEEITMSLNAFRGAQLISLPACRYAECYLRIDPYEKAYDTDMLLKLFRFKEDHSLYEKLEEQGIRIKCVMSCDITPVYEFIRDNFARAWADEALPSMLEGGCYIAVKDKKILAFGCAEATGKNFFGPCGTLKEAQGLGLYRAIAQRAFRHLKEKGYRYAISGMTAPRVRSTLRDLADAQDIERSEGSYDDLLMR